MPEGTPLMVGLDVGSTTVKAVVVNPADDKILWSDYQRHDTKQPEKVMEFLTRMEDEVGIVAGHTRMFVTGSGAGGIAPLIGAKFVQEVNAVALAVEKLYPKCGSVVELGGQDAKIIIFKEDPDTGRKKKIPSMNDKCAGGTGAVIDKINAKLHIPSEQLCQMGYDGIKLHPVAGKCGVFAETDINGLQKSGVPPDELMASLFEAIVQQNLAVLTRGNTLRPQVLLLGGPNTYIQGMKDCWKSNIPKIWEERKFPLPEGVDPASLIFVPENAQYFAALGSIEFGKDEDEAVGVYRGKENLDWYMNVGRLEEKQKKGGSGLSANDQELADFKARYKPKKFIPATFQPGQVVEGFIGIDGGSTSTKAVLLDKDKNILVKCYQLSKGNPIEDTMDMFANLNQQVMDQGATLKVLGVGTTGYAKDILKDTLNADAAMVETVAHTEAALHFYPHADVICDVGGQDIKLIILQDGRVKDFKLNTQCSAGNGYFLQSTCHGFRLRGHPVRRPGLQRQGHAHVRLRLRRFHAVGHRGFPAPGMEAGRDHGRPGQRAAEEHLAVRLADSQYRFARKYVRAAGRHAAQPGGGQGPGGFHRVALQGQGRQAQRDRARALRRVRRDRRGHRSEPALETGPQDQLHRPGRRAEDHLRHAPQRRHPLLLLQEQVPAHLH